ncbi:MAG: hypothetical protein HOO67_01525 [Candidatus Peribacteraceae bacterium]|nr:hypothetical protein [Candidatus Peribacteraceae bacterium]
MKVLALDLGTTTGWAYRGPGGFSAGSWELMTRRELTAQSALRMDRRQDGRVIRFWDRLEDFFQAHPVEWLVFEDVRFTKGLLQAHLWASFRAVVWLTAHRRKMKVECLTTDRLKAFATGNGCATKEAMAAWLPRKCKEVRFFDGATRLVDSNAILDDNAVDAAHLLLWAESVLLNEK